MNSSRFLASINNEVPERVNSTYADNFATLNNLVLVLFSADKTVVPKESSWFGSYAPSNGTDDEKTIVPMRLQPLYTEDWIGLRTLDKTGRVTLETCEGEHMQLKEECWKPLVEQYTGEVIKDDYGYGFVSDEAVFRIQN